MLNENSENKICQNCKKEFIITPNDFGFYEKMKVPAPTFCSTCRLQRRFMFRNNRVFYRRVCQLCNKSMLALYHPEKPFTVYCRECWLSDSWDPMSYGRDYDFTLPFFEQFKALQITVPRSNMYQTNFVNSEYCNYGLDFKDCYLIFGGRSNERLYFANQTFECKDSFDIAFSGKIEFSYELFECERTNKLFFSHHSLDCFDSYYLADCRNCMNCFGCVGLVNKQYYIFNQQYTKEDYENFINENIGSYEKHLENSQKIKDLEQNSIHRYARIYKSVNSDGDDLMESKNTHESFTSRGAEDCKFLFLCHSNPKNCYDNAFQGFQSEQSYELTSGFGGANTAFGVRNLYNRDSFYNEECHDCVNVFGCEGLRKKSYCIFNKQYTKEEYEELVPKIIKHMEEVPYVDVKGRIYKYGEFFPAELCPFGYNETAVQEYFPLTKEEAINQGYSWQDTEVRNYKIDIENHDMPDDIKNVEEDIIGKVIACAHAGKCKEQCTEAFKIVPEEFKFYKRMNLPLPRLCPNCRHYQRIGQRNPLKLWTRNCMCDKAGHFHGGEKCAVEFKTTYSPDRSEIIYCEKCYQQEVY